MKIADIELGVEYCETGPLAYGLEPRVNRPEKVRFTDKRPGWGWLTTHVATETKPGQRVRFVETNHVLTHPDVDPQVRTLKDRVYASVKPDEVKPGMIVLTFKPHKGHYPAEYWRNGEWQPGLCRSSAIHRTWAEYQEANAKAGVEMARRKIQSAKDTWESDLKGIAIKVHLAEVPLGDAINALGEAYGSVDVSIVKRLLETAAQDDQ